MLYYSNCVNIDTPSLNEYHEYENWCIENNFGNHQWKMWTNLTEKMSCTIVSFENVEDAMAFKLRWS